MLVDVVLAETLANGRRLPWRYDAVDLPAPPACTPGSVALILAFLPATATIFRRRPMASSACEQAA